jgi:hypothetical protein
MDYANRLLLCYRYYAWDHCDYDPETIWAYVQAQAGGAISIRAGGEIDFWIPPEALTFFILRFPLLKRIVNNDYL